MIEFPQEKSCQQQALTLILILTLTPT